MGREVMDHRAKPFMGLNRALPTLPDTKCSPPSRGERGKHPAPRSGRRKKG